jgi:hypothetical protein
MRSNTLSQCICILCFLALLTGSAFAGALFPCPSAVSSSSGSFLVLSDIQLKKLQGNSVRVEQVTLQVLQRETFVNERQRVNANAMFWDFPRWSVVLDSMPMNNEPECAMELISDDGEFLILLHIGPVLSADDAVMQIYRWDQHYDPAKGRTGDRGVLIKNIRLKEVWSPIEIANNTGMWTDESPEWFDGVKFEFSADNRQLTLKSRSDRSLRIKLEDGSVSWNK